MPGRTTRITPIKGCKNHSIKPNKCCIKFFFPAGSGLTYLSKRTVKIKNKRVNCTRKEEKTGKLVPRTVYENLGLTKTVKLLPKVIKKEIPTDK